MSKFGEYLYQLIQRKGISISKLSKESGVERTSIHKAISDERTLSYQAVKKLSNSLQLSPIEIYKLFQYYNYLFESENTRLAWNMLDKIFQIISDVPVLDYNIYLSEYSKQEDEETERSTFRGSKEISLLLRRVISREREYQNPKIDCALPPDKRIMEMCIDILREYGCCTKVSHLICFAAENSTGEYSLQNLKALCNVLGGCISFGKWYQPYYYYNSNICSEYADPLPYFLVTHSDVICFSENCQTAFYLKEEEQISYFQTYFYHIKQMCYILIEYIEESEDIWDEFCGVGEECICMMPKPCIARMQTKLLTMIFTRQGVWEYLEEHAKDNIVGKVRDQGGTELLLKFCDVLRAKKIKGRMIDDVSSIFPGKISILSAEGFGVALSDSDGKWKIRVRETSLCRAIHDWLKQFAESDHVYDMERTQEMLVEISELWQKSKKEKSQNIAHVEEEGDI